MDTGIRNGQSHHSHLQGVAAPAEGLTDKTRDSLTTRPQDMMQWGRITYCRSM